MRCRALSRWRSLLVGRDVLFRRNMSRAATMASSEEIQGEPNYLSDITQLCKLVGRPWVMIRRIGGLSDNNLVLRHEPNQNWPSTPDILATSLQPAHRICPAANNTHDEVLNDRSYISTTTTSLLYRLCQIAVLQSCRPPRVYSASARRRLVCTPDTRTLQQQVKLE